RSDVAVFDGAHRVPVALGDLAVVAAARDAHRAALLLPGAHPIGEGRGDARVVELRGGLVEPRAPGLAAVERDQGTLDAHERDDRGIVRIDPQVLVVIASRSAPE